VPATVRAEGAIVKAHEFAHGALRLSPIGAEVGWLARNPVAVEKLFLGNFNSKIRSQVSESSFAVGAEIH
jgi:hypothetical protein